MVIYFVINKIEVDCQILFCYYQNRKLERHCGMASPGQLIERMALATGSNKSTIVSLYNELRDAEEIPKGARGKNALHVTSEHAAKLLIAVCCAEHVKDAPNAVQRYSGLDVGNSVRYPLPKEDEFPTPGANWDIVSLEFPRLGYLPPQHCLLDALVALVDSYTDDAEHSADVTVSFGSPYPWAQASVILERRYDAEWRVAVNYLHRNPDPRGDGDDDPEFLTLIDPSKERQRRRFSVLDGDLRVIAKITQNTLKALGELLREDKTLMPSD